MSLNIRRLSISQRIFSISAVGIAGLVGICTINFTAEKLRDRSRAEADRARMVQSLVGKFHEHSLEMRRAEKDFLLRSDEAYIRKHADIFASARSTLDTLKADMPAALGEIGGNVDRIRAGIQTYNGHFRSLASTRVALGLDEKSGLEGSLRAAVHAIEQALKEKPLPELTIAMLMLRRHEKDFMLRRDVKYGREFESRVAEFTTALAKAELAAVTKADITQKLSQYRSGFEAWVKGALAFADAQAQTSKAYADIAPVIEEVKTAADKLRVDANVAEADFRETAGWVTIAASLGLIVLISAVGLLIGQAIATGLRRTISAMTALAGGDLGVAIAGADRGDDIGRMAKAVVVFRDAAVENLRLTREMEEARLRSEGERRKAEEAAFARERLVVSTSIGAGMARLAAKDLCFRLADDIPPAYSTLRSDFNAAIAQLEDAIVTVHSTCRAMDHGTQEISHASNDLARRTEEQAACLEEASASLQEITGTIKATADGAVHARELAASAKTEAEEGVQVSREVVVAMGRIESSSQRIGQIIGVVDEIAFQTNLLALNAGVEAARAGDAGRGFAVVASEVRALAQRSADAAKEIKSLVADSKRQVEEGVSLVGRTGPLLERIATEIVEVGQFIAKISTAAQDQASSLQQINTAIGQIDAATQRNAAMAEQATAASFALAEESRQLTGLVDQFGTGGGATRRDRPVEQAA